MRGRDRLAFRSKLGFLFVPGVVEVLVLPVKTNGPFRGGGKKNQKKNQNIIIYFLETYFKYIIPRVERPKYLEFLLQRTMQF